VGRVSAKKILLIRHAETDFAGTFCGHSDPPVNERGRLQIEQLVAELQPHKLDAVYSSDLERALATAAPIAASFSVSLQVTANLREIAFGDWENFTWEQIEQRDSAYAQRWVAEFPRLPAPSGENLASFEKRALKEFDGVIASNQSSAIVTHAGVLRVILTRRCGLSDEQAWLQTKTYCSVFAYRDGGAKL
jgi:broad specificity phosphatase PhoE